MFPDLIIVNECIIRENIMSKSQKFQDVREDVKEPWTREKGQVFCERVFPGFTVEYRENLNGEGNYMIEHHSKGTLNTLSNALLGVCGVADSKGNQKTVVRHLGGKKAILLSFTDLEKISGYESHFQEIEIPLAFPANSHHRRDSKNPCKHCNIS
jgi:hypothetical protein